MASTIVTRSHRRRSPAQICLKIVLLLGLVQLCLTWSPAPVAAETELTVGILSLRPEEVTQQAWQPVMDELSKRLPGYRFKLKALEHWELQAYLRQHLLDFVLTNPSHYIALRQENGLSGALATLINREGGQSLKSYGGVIFTRTERADLATLKDLSGRRIACAGNDGSMLGGYQAQVFEMSHAGLPLPTPNQLLITGLPQDRVVQAVLEGKADIGFVRTGMIEQLAAQGKVDPTRLKIIHRQNLPEFPYHCSTRLYPEWPFAAMPHVDEKLARQVAAVLLGMEHGSAIMRSAGIHGFSIPADYLPVESLMRELRLEPFDVAPHITLIDVWASYRWQIVVLIGAGGVITLLSGRLLAMNRSLQRARISKKSAQSALKEREQHYRALVNALPHGITVIDHDHRIVTINDTQAGWYQQAPEWFIGRHCFEAFEQREQICPHCLGTVSMRTGEGGHAEIVATRGNGRQLNLRQTVTPYLQENGTTCFIKVVEDITEDKRLAASAEQMARLASLGEMASGVAHEINNPISGIIGCAELIRNRLSSDHACNTIIDRIIREGDRIAGIVNSLLSVAHPGKVTHETFSIGDCLCNVMILYQSKLMKNGIDLVIDIPGELPPLMGDRQKIEQLLLNLISNSAYALNTRFPNPAPDKLLSISVSHRQTPDSTLCLEVYDQGGGIPQEIISKVFDPFFTTKPAGSGTGLGLGICYEIVKQFGGDIRIESEVGHFTRVTVELPAEQPAAVSLVRESQAVGMG
jgi:PAS domain S-box-containing protein